MERKRKLPARAAARLEQAAKRRTSTPPAGDGNTTRSATPALSAAGADDDDDDNSRPPSEPPQRSYLPRALQPGKPLPTIEQPQADDLSSADYQSVQESGVLSESLSRSRQKWINEGIFEKYWSKPSKRRGVAVDDPKNPPKDSMVKLGQVVITVEPHSFEATMYGVRDPKPAAVLPANRPVIMYGPSRGAMPPPPTPGSATPPLPKVKKRLSQSPAQTPAPSLPGTPLQKPVAVPASPARPCQAQPPSPALSQAGSGAPAAGNAAAASLAPTPSLQPVLQPPRVLPQQTPTPAASAALPPAQQDAARAPATPALATVAPRPVPSPSPRGVESILSFDGASSPKPQSRAPPSQPSPIASGAPPPRGGLPPALSPSPALAGRPPSVARTGPSPSPSGTPQPSSPQPPGTDSIIVTLAERASGDPELRDLMKRVANGLAPKEELDRFQAIINQITAENKRNGAAQGPSADRLLVDGRTVRFFAEEVRIILDIVLRSNPKQKSSDLRPPVGSDPLVVLLVKTALDDARVRDMVRRIGENRPQFSDATELKAVLDRLKTQVAREQELERQRQAALAGPAPLAPAGVPGPAAAAAAAAAPGPLAKANGGVNGTAAAGTKGRGPKSSTPPVAAAGGHHHKDKDASAGHNHHGVQPALRSKGPPPPPKLLDVSAVVFEFAGGTGDRFLFPKFSILEYIPMPQGPPELVASFLIVRKGSASEYGGDPDLDYYQPITIRVQAAPQSSAKLMDYFARVVAPVDEVKRYMDNIMNNMTRAEYVLLAMRLPRRDLPAAAEAAGGGAALKDEDDTVSGAGDKMDVDTKPAADGSGEGEGDSDSYVVGHPQPLQGVLWTTTATAASSAASTPQPRAVKRIVDEDQQYQSFIAGLVPKEVEEA